MRLIPTDYRGFEVEKCSNCGEIYPICVHGCPECGSTTVIFPIEMNEEVDINVVPIIRV